MAKKALILIQGISSGNGYLRVRYNDAKLQTQYDTVKNINTEQFFEMKSNWLLNSLGRLGDSLNDVWVYYRNTQARKLICKEVRNHIKELQDAGYTVDILAHSLGTVIALCSGPNKLKNLINVNRLILMGSPLGIGNPIARAFTNYHTERYSNNFTCNYIDYLWSSEDFVSKKLIGRTIDLLQSVSKTDIKVHHTSTKHDVKQYLEFIKENKILE
jgi:hypothetical protein